MEIITHARMKLLGNVLSQITCLYTIICTKRSLHMKMAVPRTNKDKRRQLRLTLSVEKDTIAMTHNGNIRKKEHYQRQWK